MLDSAAFGEFMIKIVRTVIVIGVVAACLEASSALAQAPPSAATDPAVETVASHLQTLTVVPAEHWRFHSGDLPHGEDPALDDSNWAVVSSKSEAPQDAAWYRASIVVPPTLNGYDLTGTKLWFRFEASANGAVPEIIYFNGRRVAMGEDLEPILLLDPVKPGDKVLIAVKLLQTIDKKRFEGATIKVDFASARPSPLDLLQEIEVADALLPSLGKNAEAVRNRVTEAAKAVDLNALASANQQAFDASLQKAHSILLESKGDLQGTSVALTGNSHIDAAWLWPWSETVNVVRNTFSTALQLMHEYPEYTYTQSAAAYNQWMEEKYPFVHQQIVDRVKEGRWEMVGGMWVEPDLNMPDGESLVRQLLIGKRYFKQHFGVDVRIGWNPDSFGYNWQLPQIYKKSGIDYFVTQKMAWNDTNKLPLKLFWWQSPDGSRVLTYFPHDYVNEIEPSKMASDVAIARQLNPGAPEMMHLYGVGDHGGGPTRSMLDSGLHWMKPDRSVPEMHFKTAQSFFSEIEKHIDTQDAPIWNYKLMAKGDAHLPPPPEGKLSLPVWNDELYFEYHRGVMTTQANHKRNMRKSEEQLLDAEKYSSLAWLMGGEYPQTVLTEAWQKALFNQFHDLAAGSGISAIYKDAQRDYDAIRLSTQEASTNAIHAISSRVNTGNSGAGVPIMVVNSLAWPRTDLAIFDVQLPAASKSGIAVLDDRDRALQFQQLSYDASRHTYKLLVKVEDVPSLGYEILHVRSALSSPSKNQGKVTASGSTLENSLLRVTVDSKTGCLTSIYDKVAKFESIAGGGCGNQLQAFKDTPKDYDAWNIDADFDKQVTALDNADAVELIDKGPLKATIRITRRWQNSKFIQDVSLYAGLDRVDIANKFDWHETHVLLKAAFPLAASGPQATYEIPYGSIERPTTRNNSWEAAKFEVPALRWADLGDGDHGLSLINESKYGYDAKGNVLRLSLLRSPTWPDPEADRGHHEFTYSLYPHSGDWKHALTVRRGYEFNYPLYAFQVEAHDGVLPPRHSFVGITGDNVILTALKKSEDGDALILRFYEWAGKSANVGVNLPDGATAAALTNLMEKPQQVDPPARQIDVTGNTITLPVHPYEIVSVRVDFANHR
jgi:alpha-mannosidase